MDAKDLGIELDEDTLSMLSPEERAVLEAKSDEDVTANADDNEDGGSDEGDAEGEDESQEDDARQAAGDSDESFDDDDSASIDDASVDDSAKSAPSAAELAAIAEEQEQTVTIPRITAQPVENLDERLAELKEQGVAIRVKLASDEADLQAKYESADLDEAEYRKQLAELRAKADDAREELVEQRVELKAQQQRYEHQLENSQAAMVAQYRADVKAFVAECKAEGVDYEDPNKPLLANAIDVEIKRTAEANPTWGNKKVFAEAHKTVKAQLGLSPTKTQPATKPKPEIPPSLGRLPSVRGETGSKVDWNLSGSALEKSLAGLSEDEMFDSI